MIRPRRVALACAIVAALASRAAADPTPPAAPLPAPGNTPLVWYHVGSAGHLVTDGGTDLRLPAGYYLPEPAWQALDTELRRLQDSETRLKAENDSFRTSTAGWQPGWKVLAGALVSGIVLGYELEKHL